MFKLVTLFVLLAVAYGRPSADQAPTTRHPVILVPGLEGSQLEATVDKPKTVNWLCSKKTRDWFQIWINAKEFFPEVIDCFIDNFSMTYDEGQRRAVNAPGVQIRPIGFGLTDGVEFLSKDSFTHIGPLSYFNAIVEGLVAVGYERNVNIRGAPYDWRKTPHDDTAYVANVKALVEETVAVSDGKPAVMVCHSMGCLYSHYFLNQQDAAWKAKNIKELVALAAPWAGATKAAGALFTGTNFKVFIYGNEKFRGMERSFPSSYFLLPSAPSYNEKFWSLEGKEYGANDYDTFFKTLNLTNSGQHMWEDSQSLVSALEHPGVDVSCIHGKGVDTPSMIKYTNRDDFPNSPTIENGDGDGTVNRVSLEACTKWDSNKDHKFEHQVFDSMSHLASIKDAAIVEYVMAKINGFQS